ncbi:MAG: hypothetical protein KAJ33_01440 [Thermoplasmata archaeon]|nr:hypothetical protein [Thermoplasmata archaeon]
MEIAELFTRKMKDKNGKEYEEDWVAIKKPNGKLVKQMRFEDYLKTNRYHPAIL